MEKELVSSTVARARRRLTTGCVNRASGHTVQPPGEEFALSVVIVVFASQEIVRLKYPGSLARLYSDASTSKTAFGFAFCASAPALVAGLGVFLPHGENVSEDIVAREDEDG